MPTKINRREFWDGDLVSLGTGFESRQPAAGGSVMYLRTALRTACGPFAIALILAAPTHASAAVIPLTPADFAGTSLITFDGIPDFTPVNGMTVDGVLFNYLLNNVASDALVVDGGPGPTNNVWSPNLVNISGGNANALLRLTFAEPEERLGYGFAVLTNLVIPNATTVTLFDGTDVMVGVLSAPSTLDFDPIFNNGFLGLRSTIPFVRADITFTSLAQAFAFDNLRFAPAAASVPEPASVILLLAGFAVVARRACRPEVHSDVARCRYGRN
jgi:hypothetical protein